jgi:signal transduction histidine kinase
VTLVTRWSRWALDPGRLRLLDWFPPVALLALSIPGVVRTDQPVATSIVLTVLLSAPLVLRRRYPIVVFALVFAVAIVQFWIGLRLGAGLALLVAFYTVAALRPPRVAGAAAVTLEAGLALAAARFSGGNGWLLAFVFLSGMATAAGVLGVYARTRAALLSQLHERADRVERERDQEIVLAGADERARIARELHDVVAHHLTVMIALADGAAAAVSTSPARAADVMTTVSATGRKALADTRRLLGVLRADPTDSLNPQPGISRLEALMEQVRSAGLPATITVTGRHRELSSALQLTIYRLVQEALTNTLKHAGPDTHAFVRLAYTDAGVELEVRDDGLGTAEGAEPSGHGLTGMRERVAAWDGELRAGPAAPRGWLVSARLPTESVEAGSR